MQTTRSRTRAAKTLTVGIRPAQPRMGTTHTYEINGSRIRDVLVDGKWITVAVEPLIHLAA
jgi:hypothetical protein